MDAITGEASSSREIGPPPYPEQQASYAGKFGKLSAFQGQSFSPRNQTYPRLSSRLPTYPRHSASRNQPYFIQPRRSPSSPINQIYAAQPSSPPTHPGRYFSQRNTLYLSQQELRCPSAVQYEINQLNMHNHYSVQPGYSVTRQTNKHLQDLALPGGYHSHATASSSSPQQFLGGTAWQPQYSKPPQAYEDYGEISACMHIKPHENKAFIGSSMSPDNGISEEEFSFWAEKLMSDPKEMAELEKICIENINKGNEKNERKEELCML